MKKEKKDEFYIGYLDSVPVRTKRTLRNFVAVALLLLVTISAIFAFTQNTFKNSSFELTTSTKIVGVYHENPYPMIKVQISKGSFKNILLLGFGKASANTYLKKVRMEVPKLSGSTLSIEGNLIYYNGKTLLQITDDEKIKFVNKANANSVPKESSVIKNMQLQGEIIDPKCYFGVMKPGKGKIHRSCAVLCISGGIPPVLATNDDNNISEYYLITNLTGGAINQEILPYVGKPSLITGTVVKIEDWYQLRIDPNKIEPLERPSKIY